jgi:hypothetical protein
MRSRIRPESFPILTTIGNGPLDSRSARMCIKIRFGNRIIDPARRNRRSRCIRATKTPAADVEPVRGRSCLKIDPRRYGAATGAAGLR